MPFHSLAHGETLLSARALGTSRALLTGAKRPGGRTHRMVDDLQSWRCSSGFLGRPAFLAALAVLFFVLSYSPSRTWTQVERSADEGFDTELAAAAASNETGSSRRQLAGVALALLGAVAAVKSGGFRLWRRGPLPCLVLAYCALCTLSLFWSEEPALTVRRLAGFGALALATLGAIRTLRAEDIGQFALLASAAFVLTGAAVEIAGGAFHPLAEGYRFSGVFHPNTLGSFCAVLVLAAACADRESRGVWRFAVAMAGMVILILTRSRTALGSLLLALAARWLVTARPSRIALTAMIVSWLGCVALLSGGEEFGPRISRALLMSRADSDPSSLTMAATPLVYLRRDRQRYVVRSHLAHDQWAVPHPRA